MTIADDWSTADLVACLERADPEAYAQVIRVLAERIAGNAAAVTDPRSLLLDLGHAADSLSTVGGRVTRRACAVLHGNELDETVAHLVAGGRGLRDIADGWI